MNKIILIGRLTKDPELRYTPNNQAVCTFTLAVDKQLSKEKKQEAENYNKPTADFPRVQTWGNTAENIARYMKKGSQLGVVGRLQTGSYKDKETGNMVYTTEVVAENIEFLSKSEPRQQVDDEFFGEDFKEITDNTSIPF